MSKKNLSMALESKYLLPFMAEVLLTPAAAFSATFAFFASVTDFDGLPPQLGAIPVAFVALFVVLKYGEDWWAKRLKNKARNEALKKFKEGKIDAEDLDKIMTD